MKHPSQLPLYLPVQTSYTSIDFIQSPCNQEALQWIHAWPEWTGQMGVIFGARGCGKTHLAHIWQESSEARFISLTDIQNLTPLDAIKDGQAFVFDDADNILQQHDGIEKWLFHFYNLIQEKGAYLLVCSHQSPGHWQVRLPDLQSRLSTLVSIAVNPPGEEALRTILYKLCSERGMGLPVEVADYILRRIERSFESARILVDTLDRYTLSTRRQLTVGLIREMFQAAG